MVEIGVPQNITDDNIVIDLRDNILEISFSKKEEIKNDDVVIQNSIGFSRFFVVPQTTAKTTDVKHSIEDGVVKVVVPIVVK